MCYFAKHTFIKIISPRGRKNKNTPKIKKKTRKFDMEKIIKLCDIPVPTTISLQFITFIRHKVQV